MEAEEATYNKIIGAIQNIGETGATIDELSKLVPLERHTLSKYLNRLRADGRISYKQIGRAKVWFVSRAPLQPLFRLSEAEKTYTERIFSRILADMPGGVLVLDFDSNILFMNQYLIALYGNRIGQKYYHAIFGIRKDQNKSEIDAIIEAGAEEVETQANDKEGRILNIKARKVENPDHSFSIIALVRDVSEKVRREERIKNLSELHRLLGESVNRSYTIDQLCSSVLENLRDIIYYDMGDILIYNPENNVLYATAQIGYPLNLGDEFSGKKNRRQEVEEWKKGVATTAIRSKKPLLFDFTFKKKNELVRDSHAFFLADVYNLQEMYTIPLKTKGELHGALLILMAGRVLSKEERSLLEGVSEEIAGGIAKIKLEEELRLKANAIEISIDPIFMADNRGKLTYVNPAFLNLWGYNNNSEKDVLGRSCTAFWKQRGKDILSMVQEKGSWEGELTGVRKDGSEFNIRLSASLVIGKKGPLQLVAVVKP